VLINYFSREQIAAVREKTTIKFGEIYDFKIKSVEEKHWEDGNTSLSLQLIPMSGDVEFPLVFEMLSNNTKYADAMDKNLDFFESIGRVDLLKSGKVTAPELIGQMGKAIFYQSNYNGKTQARVERYIPRAQAEFNDDIKF
jgi:hypothetical protein